LTVSQQQLNLSAVRLPISQLTLMEAGSINTRELFIRNTIANITMNKPYYKYAVDVVEDKVVCCENIKLACKRFLSDLEREDLEFREDAVDNAISFIGILKHFAGKSSG
jgi:hypothetical protein